jgi:transposase-like protein
VFNIKANHYRLIALVEYKNGVVIKRRSGPMLGLKSFQTAAVIFSGIELAHRAVRSDFEGRAIARGTLDATGRCSGYLGS